LLASGASIEQRQTTGLVQEQQSRLAPVLFVPGARAFGARRTLALANKAGEGRARCRDHVATVALIRW
jgi:hypothetical protein